MDIKPLKNIETPRYPKKEDLCADTIKQSVPKRWALSTAAKVALGMLAAMSLAGCTYNLNPGIGTQSSDALKSDAQQASASSIVSSTEYITEGIVAPAMLNVAPLFEHGKGRGAFGCDMVTPPAFISEDEALTVVNEVAIEYGLKFSKVDSPSFSNVLQPVTNIYEPDDIQPSDKVVTLKTDFADKEHGVAIEFISEDDVKQWHMQTDYMSSVEEYDTQDAAEQLSEALESAANTEGADYTSGVIYDPCEFSGETDPGKAKEVSKAQLKLQAEDFFEWLRKQGII